MRVQHVIFFLILLLSRSPQAGEHAATFRNPTAVSGKCLENLQQPAHAILNAKRVTVKNGKFIGKKTVAATGGADADLSENVARVVQRIDSLTGGVGLPAVTGLVVWKIPNLDILARQTPQGLTMSSNSVNNIANIAHELGHKVGNDGSPRTPYTWYGLYRKEVPNVCAVTRYCHAAGTHPRQEEFAEVFAAYLTNPQMLLSGGPSCIKAFNFLRTNMFRGKETSCANGDPISIIRRPDTRKGPFDPNTDDKDCPPPNAPLATKNRKNIESLASTTENYLHVKEHEEGSQEESQEDLQEQTRKSAKEEERTLSKGFGTVISFVPAVAQIYMQNQQARDISNAQVQLLSNGGGLATPAPMPIQTWTPMSALPTAAPIGLQLRNINISNPGTGIRTVDPLNPPLFKKSIEVPEGQ